MPTPTNALSCVTCRSRKVRCDKVRPCSACQRVGVECVFPSQRAERRTHGRRNDELLRRLDHLEGLVARLGGKAKAESSDGKSAALLPPVLPPTEDGTHPVMKVDGGRYLGEDFWTSLSGEVEGLRELLNEPTSDDDEEATRTVVRSPLTPELHEERLLNSLFVFSGGIEATDLTWLHPPGPQIEALAEIYFDRVDIIFKVLHRPTFVSLVNAAAADAANILKGGGEEALMFAMYFASVTSLTPEECLELFGKDKASLAAQFRRCCEISLGNADFLNSTDMTVLQAFVIYLLCLRCHNRTRSVWTLVSLAARIAQDLNLHHDGAVTGFSPFDTEMRRRLWWQITILDIRACEDRGSFPLIDHSLCSTIMPLNINDEDMDPESRNPPAERMGYTEMSFSRLCQEASVVAPRFFSPVPANVDDDQKRDDWQVRTQQEVETFKKRLHAEFLVHCDPSVPVQYVISQVVQIITTEFWLLVHYPIQTRRYAFKSKATKAEVLETAILHLRVDYGLKMHPMSAKYKWYYDTYVQWHPLAVALAELCVQTRGPAIDKAWQVVDSVYDRARSLVTDVSLWRPVKKLYQKAKKARAHALGATADGAREDGPESSVPSSSPQPVSGMTGIPQLPPSNFDKVDDSFASGEKQQHQSSRHPNALATGQQDPTVPTPADMDQGLDFMSAEAICTMSNMNLDAHADPVNWQDWDDFVQSTWIAGEPDQQYNTNTAEWMT